MSKRSNWFSKRYDDLTAVELVQYHQWAAEQCAEDAGAKALHERLANEYKAQAQTK